MKERKMCRLEKQAKWRGADAQSTGSVSRKSRQFVATLVEDPQPIEIAKLETFETASRTKKFLYRTSFPNSKRSMELIS